MKSISLDTIQLLPLNDSGFDPSPYNALSSCALNPIYISLWTLPNLDSDLKAKLPALRDKIELTHFPYEEVLTRKLHFLDTYFKRNFETISQTPDYLRFVETNTWLAKYNLFKHLLDRHDFKPWSTWTKTEKTPSQFYTFLQYLCFTQLSEVKKYASERSILIKGDIPILISPESVDVWAHPNLFDTTHSAGAPPDVFNAEGQNWGFPLYNWKNIFEENFEWWKTRLQLASNYYDIYRIDHIIGFFRIWAMKQGQEPLKGKFIPDEEWEYLSQGRHILEAMITSSNMLPIGEDLGIIPPSVHKVLRDLGICRTIVPRWEKHWATDKTYIDPSEYQPFSLTTVSTHDSETLAQWWTKYPDEMNEFTTFHNLSTTLDFETRYRILEICHNTPSHFHISLIGEYLALFPELIWPNPDDERINRPGYILPKNWTYRIRPSIEELTAHHGLTDILGRLAK